MDSVSSEVERLRAELVAARQRCERQDEFLALAAHELRAPLGAILGWAHMLRQRPGAEEVDKGLDVIEQSVQVQARLIDDLLVASRMASTGIHLRAAPVDLAALACVAAESARPCFQDKQVELRQSVEPVGPVTGDATRLHQVLANLLANAVKFTPAGGRVELALRPSRGFAVVSVRDDGIGIAPSFLPHVFERFSQEHDAARSHGGLGLGLAIARHLVELHGGEITAASDGEGRGATFTVRLPLAG